MSLWLKPQEVEDLVDNDLVHNDLIIYGSVEEGNPHVTLCTKFV